MNLLLSAGVICIVITGILSGGWTTGYQQRGNFHSESKKDRDSKKKVANWFLVAGLIFFALAAVIKLFR